MDSAHPLRRPPERKPPRAMCARCERPVRVCYCAALTTIETRSRIVILQHPREHGMPIGTAHMATLCLPAASLHVGTAWDASDVLQEACADPARPPILLYPGPDARDILSEPPAGPVTLVVVDGTWSQARTLVRDNPQLAALPRYAFHAPEPSNYRIRREPSDACVSTIEAIMHVLGPLEGDPARFRALMQPMNAMVDAQLRAQEEARAAAEPRRTPRAKTKRRRTPRERLPRELRERPEDVVLVSADANAWPHGTPERRYGDELVYWVGHRPATGAWFSSVVAPRNPLAPDVPGHIGLDAETLKAGDSLAALHAAFAAFTRPEDVICSWGYHGIRLFKDSGGVLPGAVIDLQRTARTLSNSKVSTVESYADIAETSADVIAGRAGYRLRLMAHVLERWSRA